MELQPVRAVKAEVILPVGAKLKATTPWYPQESCGEWPHQASALSLGESTILKYGVSYPLRSGLDTADEKDFVENVTFVESSPVVISNSKGKEEAAGTGGIVKDARGIEELYVSRGVCLVTEGPLGGPSFCKGLYRPLTSYSSGVGIKSVVKAFFPRDMKEGSDETDAYICLVEKGGISLYADGRNESHVAYMPEFQIDRVIPATGGLIVVPDRQFNNTTEDSKFLYILTHPIKQVSRIWARSQPGTDFFEFDASREKLLWCENDLCIFWSLNNDKFILRRLVHLDKNDVVHSTTLNASIYYSNQESSGGSHHSPFTPAGGSASYSPLGKIPPRTSAMRVNREGNTVYYWPSFDFSDSNPGLSAGFYPPHYSVYDDPEYYVSHMFEIELNPSGRWIEPQKFQLVPSQNGDLVGLWYKMRSNLYLYSVNIKSGSKVTTWATRNVKDFVCSTPSKLKGTQVVTVVILTTDNELQIGWVDDDFNLVLSVKLLHSLERRIESVDSFLFCDTLICSLENEEKAHIVLRNIGNNGLVSKCIDGIKEVVPSEVLVTLVAYYMAGDDNPVTFDEEWNLFTQVVIDVIEEEEQEAGTKSKVAVSLYKALAFLKESLKASRFSAHFVDRVSNLLSAISSHTKNSAQLETAANASLYSIFLELLLHPNPSSCETFSSLPELLQILLESPDELSSLKRLAELKASGHCFSPVFDILVADVFRRNECRAAFKWPRDVLENVGRDDILCGLSPDSSSKSFSEKKTSNSAETSTCPTGKSKETDPEEGRPWTTSILTERVFSIDRRLEEVCRLLDSASPLTIELEQRAEMSDHEFVEEQEKHLLQMMQVTFSAPVGRTAFTLRTEVKDFANLTNVIHLPKLCTSGKCSTRGTTIELHDLNPAWPSFHNAVASSAAVRFSDQPTDAWFAYNKAKTNEGPEQAGMVLGFGLNGILTSMPPTLRHEYLAKENSFTSMAMLLGLSANLAGTGDIATWKVISLHIGAMLPTCTTELEIPRLATLVAPCALGLLFMGTQNSHVAKILLGEISKRYNPLAAFGSGGANNSQNNANPSEVSGSIVDREAHSLCAGFGLGFVNLGKCKSGTGSLDADGFEGILRRFVVGGPKPAMYNDEEDDPYNQYGQTLPSLWEEFRCCHIEEGDNVNVDVTTPSAIVAVALTYLKSGNEAVLYWLSPPTTLYLLDGVRPDILMLRSLASILVHDDLPDLSVEWLEMNLMPKVLRESALKKPDEFSRLDHESINQAWASIVSGYCLGLGIRLAGTSDEEATETLWHYVEVFLKMSSPDCSMSEYFPKNFLESSLCTLLIGLSLILAGTGHLRVLQLCRLMQAKVASTSQITSNSNTYGMEMCVAMATGILFLGGGRYSLSNDDKSIAVLLASVFPKWPINANDNRYHLQALRHLYLLAAQPRLILTKPLSHSSPLKLSIEYLDGRIADCPVPVLLPPFHLIKKISFQDSEFSTIEFDLPADLPYLKRIVEGDGVITLVPKAATKMQCGFLKHMGWREERVVHLNFLDDDSVPNEERSVVKELNLISRIAEAAGLNHVMPSLLALKSGDSTDADWIQQIRILYWWTSRRSSSSSLPTDLVKSCIPIQLLGLFFSKAGSDFKIFDSKISS